MSDALTDIARDGDINHWCEANITPLIRAYAMGEATREATLDALTGLREANDIPLYRGYWNPPATDILEAIIRDVEKSRPETMARWKKICEEDAT